MKRVVDIIFLQLLFDQSLSISVTPISSKMVKCRVVKDHNFPAIPPAKLCDQFDFNPTSSITAALVDITNKVPIILDTMIVDRFFKGIRSM